MFMSRCAPELRRSTRPGFGVSISSLSSAPEAYSATKSAVRAGHAETSGYFDVLSSRVQIKIVHHLLDLFQELWQRMPARASALVRWLIAQQAPTG